MNKYVEITVYTTHIGGEIISDLFWNYTENGVVIYDVQDVIDLDREGKSWDYADESIFNADKTVLVKGYFSEQEEGNIKNLLLDIENTKVNSGLDLGSLEVIKREIDGDEWRLKWKEHFKPIHIGNVVIVPEWIKYTENQNEIKVLLDSNMAFGTGEHETTSMCVEYLQKYVSAKDVVIDVGCGSGILGITAKKLGSKSVLMTDIDECAVTAAIHNIELNKVSDCQVLLKNLLDDESIKGNVIVCNIMAEVLIAFAPYIANNLLDNGKIILSGILADRLDKVRLAYEKAGFKYLESKVKGEWSALVMQREN